MIGTEEGGSEGDDIGEEAIEWSSLLIIEEEVVVEVVMVVHADTPSAVTEGCGVISKILTPRL